MSGTSPELGQSEIELPHRLGLAGALEEPAGARARNAQLHRVKQLR